MNHTHWLAHTISLLKIYSFIKTQIFKLKGISEFHPNHESIYMWNTYKLSSFHPPVSIVWYLQFWNRPVEKIIQHPLNIDTITSVWTSFWVWDGTGSGPFQRVLPHQNTRLHLKAVIPPPNLSLKVSNWVPIVSRYDIDINYADLDVFKPAGLRFATRSLLLDSLPKTSDFEL